WVCAVTRPGSEFVIAATLELEEVETYLPVCNPIRANTVYRKALFPGYFFAKLCEKRLKLPTIAAIADLICIDDEPVLVRQQVIDELRLRNTRRRSDPRSNTRKIPVHIWLACSPHSGRA